MCQPGECGLCAEDMEVMEESKQGSDMLFGIHSLCCSIKDRLWVVSLGLEAGRRSQQGLRKSRRREWGNTLRRLNGQASELEAVSEGAKTRFRVWLGTEGL